MTTQKPPFWWNGTLEEWNRVAEHDRELVRAKSGPARDEEAARLLAVARNEQYKPAQSHAKSDTGEPKKTNATAIHFHGIRNWTESVQGVSAERIRNCILYLLDVKKDPWYISNCNNKAFVRRMVLKMDEQVPEDYHYDPNAVLGTKRQHIDGENHPVVITIVQKDAKDITEKDRKELREKYGVCDQTIRYLAKQDCKKCNGTGFVEISDYPDDPLYAKLASWDSCYCVWE